MGLFQSLWQTLKGKSRLRAVVTEHPLADAPLTFPEGFFWGVATSAQQIESQQPTDWTAFERDAFAHKRFDTGEGMGIALPGHIHDLGAYSETVRSQKTGFDQDMGQDFATAQSLGLNAFRFSVDWARLYPRAGMNGPDSQGLAYYQSAIAQMKRHGLTPFATLFHFSSPAWFFESDATGRKGWERSDALVHWQQFVQTVADHFVPDVLHWCTLNEPVVYVYNGYIEGVFPPLERRANVGHAVDVVRALLRAHAAAYHILHKVGLEKQQLLSVGLTQHTRAFQPLRNWNPLDRITARIVDQAWNWDFTDAVASGRMRLSNTAIDEPIEGLKGSQDYVGVNYYGRIYVKFNWRSPTMPQVLLHDPQAIDEVVNEMGWAIYPCGFFEILVEANRRYGLPVFVLENGTADSADNDLGRQKFLVAHVREMALAIREEQVDVRAYLHWSLIDNFEWAEGFTARFGLVKVDYANGFQRTPRPSAALYSDIATHNALTQELLQRFAVFKP